MRVTETKPVNARVPEPAIAGGRVIGELRPIPFYLVVDFDANGWRAEGEVDDADVRGRREARRTKAGHNRADDNGEGRQAPSNIFPHCPPEAARFMPFSSLPGSAGPSKNLHALLNRLKSMRVMTCANKYNEPEQIDA
jgi:hypothetical protein